MYVRESQAGQCQHHELRVQPHPGDCHQARDQGDCGHSAEQPGPGQIFAVDIQFTCKISSVSKVWKCFGFFNDELKIYLIENHP